MQDHFNPDSIGSYMGHKQYVLSRLSAEPGEATETELRTKFEAALEKLTGIKVGDVVRVCESNGISLVGGMKPLHDHDDPKQHTIGRVVECTCWGDIYYTKPTGDPGFATSSTHIGMINPAEEPESFRWYESSDIAVGAPVSFVWAATRMSTDLKKGQDMQATVLCPYNEPGKWIVRFKGGAVQYDNQRHYLLAEEDMIFA